MAKETSERVFREGTVHRVTLPAPKRTVRDRVRAVTRWMRENPRKVKYIVCATLAIGTGASVGYSGASVALELSLRDNGAVAGLTGGLVARNLSVAPAHQRARAASDATARTLGPVVGMGSRL